MPANTFRATATVFALREATNTPGSASRYTLSDYVRATHASSWKKTVAADRPLRFRGLSA